MGDLHIAPWNKLLKITLVKEHRKLKERGRESTNRSKSESIAGKSVMNL